MLRCVYCLTEASEGRLGLIHKAHIKVKRTGVGGSGSTLTTANGRTSLYPCDYNQPYFECCALYGHIGCLLPLDLYSANG